jgi:hypothetical protein
MGVVGVGIVIAKVVAVAGFVVKEFRWGTVAVVEASGGWFPVDGHP